MRLEAGDPGAHLYTVFHVPTCHILRSVQWVDGATAQWRESIYPFFVVDGELAWITHQAKKIVIDTENHIVLIDPIEFSDLDVQSAVDFIQKTEWEGA